MSSEHANNTLPVVQTDGVPAASTRLEDDDSVVVATPDGSLTGSIGGPATNHTNHRPTGGDSSEDEDDGGAPITSNVSGTTDAGPSAAATDNDDGEGSDSTGTQPPMSPAVASAAKFSQGSPDEGVDSEGDATSPAKADLHQPEPVDCVFPDVAPFLDKWMNLIASILHNEDTVTDVITPDAISDLCEEAANTLKSEPPMLELTVPDDSELVIVGDVHGQCTDLVQHILPQTGPGRKFLFLGDYVDRGPQSIEAILLLLALKVEFPAHIFLLRGNHEDAQTSRIYGFFNEVASKFGEEGVRVWSDVNQVFCSLPVAASVTAPVTGKKLFCAHGGLSPALTIADLKTIERQDYGSTLDNEATTIVDGLLWSDPSTHPNAVRFRGNERGCGYIFGSNATEEFLMDNGFDLLVRAHQMSMQGYDWNHDGKCLTVFSAPNYCGISYNLGAVVLVNGEGALKFVQYDATESRAAAPAPNMMMLPPFFSV